jgi:hypothetical protein
MTLLRDGVGVAKLVILHRPIRPFPFPSDRVGIGPERAQQISPGHRLGTLTLGTLTFVRIAQTERPRSFPSWTLIRASRSLWTPSAFRAGALRAAFCRRAPHLNPARPNDAEGDERIADQPVVSPRSLAEGQRPAQQQGRVGFRVLATPFSRGTYWH